MGLGNEVRESGRSDVLPTELKTHRRVFKLKKQTWARAKQNIIPVMCMDSHFCFHGACIMFVVLCGGIAAADECKQGYDG